MSSLIAVRTAHSTITYIPSRHTPQLLTPFIQRRYYAPGPGYPVFDPKKIIPLDPERPKHPTPPIPPKKLFWERKGKRTEEEIQKTIKDLQKATPKRKAQQTETNKEQKPAVAVEEAPTTNPTEENSETTNVTKELAEASIQKNEVTLTPMEQSLEETKKNSVQQFADEVREYLGKNNTDGAYEVLVTMRRFELPVPRQLFEDVLVNFATNKQVSKVKEVIAFMERDNVMPSETTFMKVVRAYGAIRQYEWVKNTFLRMTASLKPSPKSYEETIRFFGLVPHVSNLRKAEEVFFTAHVNDVRPTPATCYHFIKQLCSSNYEGDVDRAIEVLKFMKTKNIELPLKLGLEKVFLDHLAVLIEPRHFVRVKKVLVGLLHGGVSKKRFEYYWHMLDKKKWINRIKRADMAPP